MVYLFASIEKSIDIISVILAAAIIFCVSFTFARIEQYEQENKTLDLIFPDKRVMMKFSKFKELYLQNPTNHILWAFKYNVISQDNELNPDRYGNIYIYFSLTDAIRFKYWRYFNVKYDATGVHGESRRAKIVYQDRMIRQKHIFADVKQDATFKDKEK